MFGQNVEDIFATVVTVTTRTSKHHWLPASHVTGRVQSLTNHSQTVSGVHLLHWFYWFGLVRFALVFLGMKEEGKIVRKSLCQCYWIQSPLWACVEIISDRAAWKVRYCQIEFTTMVNNGVSSIHLMYRGSYSMQIGQQVWNQKTSV